MTPAEVTQEMINAFFITDPCDGRDIIAAAVTAYQQHRKPCVWKEDGFCGGFNPTCCNEKPYLYLCGVGPRCRYCGSPVKAEDVPNPLQPQTSTEERER